MSVKDRSLSRIEKVIRNLYQQEKESKHWIHQKLIQARRFALMLFHEILNDDVGIRAQSFSYLTLFSVLPILAGLFILFGFMSQWGPIEKGFESFLAQMLEPIPSDYRDTLIEFVLAFKDQYALSMQEKSASIGILALGVLVWVTAKVFFNIEDLMNRVWSARTNRDWFQRVQNFILASVVFPVVAAISFSLPSILERWGTNGIKASVFMGEFLPLIMFSVVLSLMFKFFPNVRVSWKSALAGAFFSTTLFAASNILLKIYFRFGTNTAYGKIAVLPIIAFFIYVLWFIFILGAEVSYLVQNQQNFIGRRMPHTTLSEASLLNEIVLLFSDRFKKGAPLLSSTEVAIHFNVSTNVVQKVFRFLVQQGMIIESVSPPDGLDSVYILARDPESVSMVTLLQRYLYIEDVLRSFPNGEVFKEVLQPFTKK